MELGPFKPILTLLALPPAAPLLLAVFGLLLAALIVRARRFGMLLAWLGVGSLWLLGCSAFAVLLAGWLLPDYPPQSAATLQAARVQAIVVLGGGVVADNPEYGVSGIPSSAQPNGYTLARLRYGAWLARETGLPMAYSGGVGWANKGDMPPPPEGMVAQRVLHEEYRQPLRWVDNRARDTQENAELLAPMLLADDIRRIALVTSYPHMARSLFEFRQMGFDAVLPAPTGYYRPWHGDWLAWLPSASGLTASWYVLRERLGLEVAMRRQRSSSAATF